jgi:hypothetical protein
MQIKNRLAGGEIQSGFFPLSSLHTWQVGAFGLAFVLASTPPKDIKGSILRESASFVREHLSEALLRTSQRPSQPSYLYSSLSGIKKGTFSSLFFQKLNLVLNSI